MKIEIELNAEQQAALASLLERYNANVVPPASAENYLAAVLGGIIDDEVRRLYEAAVRSLGEAFAPQAYEHRVALIGVNAALAGLTAEDREVKLREIQSLL